MSRKTQVVDFLHQQGRNRSEQADLLARGHAPNAQAIGKMRDAARLFDDAAKMCEAYEGPASITSDESYRAEMAQRAEDAKAPAEKNVAEAPKVRKKWTRKAIAESKEGPAIAANDRD